MSGRRVEEGWGARVGQADVHTQARVKHARARTREQKRVYRAADMAVLPPHGLLLLSFSTFLSVFRFTSLFYWIFMI